MVSQDSRGHMRRHGRHVSQGSANASSGPIKESPGPDRLPDGRSLEQGSETTQKQVCRACPTPGRSLQPGRIVRCNRRRIKVPSSSHRSSAQGLRARRPDARLAVGPRAVPPDEPARPQPDARPHARPGAAPDVRQLVRGLRQDAGPLRWVQPHAVPPDVTVRPRPDARPHARPAALPDVRQPVRGPPQDAVPPRSVWLHARPLDVPVRPPPDVRPHARRAGSPDAGQVPPRPRSDVERRPVRSLVPRGRQALRGRRPDR